MSSPFASRPRLRAFAQLLISLSLLALVFALIDERILFDRVGALDPTWVVIAIAVSIPQYMLSAARWQLTAKRLGAALFFRSALSEYYLSVLTNQILPGGVLGDAARAYRHGRKLKQRNPAVTYGPAIRAVIYERLAGQLVFAIVMIAGLALWPLAFDAGEAAYQFGAALIIAVFVAALGAYVFARSLWLVTPTGTGIRSYIAEARHALFAREVALRQAIYSFAIIATYLFDFYCAARAIGIELSFLSTMALVPVVLFSMTVPVTVAGWGVREATAGAVWGLAGLTPAVGVAISVTYGVIVLLSALPGVFFAFPKSVERHLGDQG
jgi:uncharacterized membrane protein YbhN (UPF0104 family)